MVFIKRRQPSTKPLFSWDASDWYKRQGCFTGVFQGGISGGAFHRGVSEGCFRGVFQRGVSEGCFRGVFQRTRGIEGALIWNEH